MVEVKIGQIYENEYVWIKVLERTYGGGFAVEIVKSKTPLSGRIGERFYNLTADDFIHFGYHLLDVQLDIL
jgi:hypothetical protein